MIGLFQPEVGRRLSGHPITDKLVMAVNFGFTDHNTGAGAEAGVIIPEDTGVAGPGTWFQSLVAYAQGNNRYGRWAGFDGATINSTFVWPRGDFLPTSTGCTVLTLYEKGDSTNRNSVAFTPNVPDDATGLTQRCSGHIPFSDGVVYWDYGGVTAGTSRLAVSGLSFGADRWVFSTGARGMEVWQNGILRGSNSGNTTRVASASSQFVLGAKTATSTFSDVAHYNLFAMWARQLTLDEIYMVSADPYMLWDSPSALASHVFIPEAVTPGEIPRYSAQWGSGNLS